MASASAAAGLRWLDDLGRDTGYAIRTWQRHPGFAIVCLLTLAIGIGGVTSVFSVVAAVLVRPLPYAHADRLIAVWDSHVNDRNLAKIFASYTDFETWQRESRTVEQFAAVTWAVGDRTLTGYGDARVVLAIPTSVDFFPLLGVAPAIGRTFDTADLTRGCTVVLAASFWRSVLSAPADIAGRSLALDGRACSVAGVMPDSFAFYPAAADMWMLITPTREQLPPDRYQGVGVFGRVRAGVTRERASAELAAIHRAAHANDAHGAAFAPTVFPLQHEFTWLAGRNLQLTLWVLFAAVAAVLLIASLDAAALFVGRSVARQRELAIRASLGSGRSRLARQMMTEAIVLAAAAAALGLVIADGVVRYLRSHMPVDLPPGTTIILDGRIVMFAIGIAALTALVFGTLPAWRSSRIDALPALKAHASSIGAPRANHATGTFVAVQMASAMALLVGAGLLIESVARLGSVPLGFNPDAVLTMSVRLPRPAYPRPAQRAAFYQRLVAEAGGTPGVTAAALTTALLRGGGLNMLLIEGRPDPRPETSPPDVTQDSVSPDYFQVMGVPLIAGRPFRDGDALEAAPVAIVSRSLARKYFPDGDAIGRRIRTPNTTYSTIVGVVGDQKTASVFEEMARLETATIFRPIAQTAPPDASLVVSSTAPASVAGSVQRGIAALDRDVAVANVQTLQQRLAKDLAYPRFRALVLTALAAIALALAAVGLYAVLAQAVTERTAEFGVRMALGARTADIVRLVAAQGVVPTVAGLVVGIAAAIAIARLLSGLLFGIGAADPAAIAAVAAVFILSAAAAMYFPARRASRIDPLAALRSE